MEDFQFISNGKDCHNYMLEKILNAEKLIFISSWHIELNYLLYKDKPLYKILLDKCRQGVKVYIITSVAPSTNCYINNTKIMEKIKHPNFNFKMIDMEESSTLHFFLRSLKYLNTTLFPFKKCCKKLFHQRYFNVDNKHCMMGSVDMAEDLHCNMSKNNTNSNNFYWIEYGVVFYPPKEFTEFCVNNFYSDGESSLKSKYFYGNFMHENTEYNFIRKLIKNSSKSILIENQWVFSTNNTKNRIIHDILNKCISNKNFQLILISNVNYVSSCHKKLPNNFFTKFNCSLNTYVFRYYFYQTLQYMYNYLKSRHMSTKEINKKIKIYVNSENMLVHSKNIIIDHDKMIYGTSNLWDRSFTKGNDIELSIFLQGPKVTETEKKIIKQYKGYHNTLDDSEYLKRVYLTNKLNTYSILFYTLIIGILIIVSLLYFYKTKNLL